MSKRRCVGKGSIDLGGLDQIPETSMINLYEVHDLISDMDRFS